MSYYYVAKKLNGLIFTEKNINDTKDLIPAEPVGGISYWSRELGRYRTSKEQAEYVRMLASKTFNNNKKKARKN